WSVPVLVALAPAATIPRAGGISVDGKVLVFTLLTTLVTSIIFGAVPAIQASKCDLNETLKQSGRASDSHPGRRRLRSVLVICEVAIAVLLLVGAGMLFPSFVPPRNVNPGFKPDHVLSVQISVPPAKFSAVQSTTF